MYMYIAACKCTSNMCLFVCVCVCVYSMHVTSTHRGTELKRRDTIIVWYNSSTLLKQQAKAFYLTIPVRW